MSPRRPTLARTTGDLATAVLFALALGLPLGGRFLDAGADTSVLPELRNPAPVPRSPRSLSRLVALPGQCEAWLDDSFGFRRWLVRGHNAVKVFGFGVSPTERAVMSPDLWVFTTVNQTFEAYRGTLQLSVAELERWRVVLEGRRDWLAARGIDYVFCFAPAKGTLYPERLPPGFRRGEQTTLEQLRAYLAEHSDFQVLDLHAPLLAAKSGDREEDWLYYKLGSHWTERGAFVAARAILRSLRSVRPDISVHHEAQYMRFEVPGQGDNWAGRLHLEDLLLQRRFGFRPPDGWSTTLASAGHGALGTRVHQEASGPRLLLLHDSFGDDLLPVLAESFSTAHSRASFGLDDEHVRDTVPDVVVQVMAERRLAIHRPAFSLGSSQASARKAFEGAQHALALFDDPRALHELEPWAGARLIPPAEAGPLELRCRSAAQGFLLPDLEVPPGSSPVLRLDLTSPQETSLAVLYQTAGRPEYLPSRARHVPLPAGRSQVYVTVPAEDLAGRLLVLPGRRRARYQVHAIEVRAE